mmetsp:Transcript_27062/g.49753  ORF Transcript_27062/g.49753 Transcript_27062/m.49753 type:complete len:184 (+) Transcript_27062:60-611(+)
MVVPIRCTTFLLALPLLKLVDSAKMESSLSTEEEFGVLNDANFEHDTQATSGATTGDWLVLFYSKQPKVCSSCESAQGMWKEVRTGLLERKEEGMTPYVNAAKVNLDANPKLKRRFKQYLGKLPAVLLFRQAKMYELKDMETKNADVIIDFATTSQADALAHAVPPEPGVMESILEYMRGGEL